MPEGSPVFSVEILEQDERGVTCMVTEGDDEIGEMDVEILSSTPNGQAKRSTLEETGQRMFVSAVSAHEKINNGSYAPAMLAVAACLKGQFPKLQEVVGLENEII